MAPHSSTLAWKIPWTEEPGGLQSMGSLSETRLSNLTFTFHFHALEKEMATHSSVLAWRIPGTGEPGGLPSMGSQSRTRLKRLSSSSDSTLYIIPLAEYNQHSFKQWLGSSAVFPNVPFAFSLSTFFKILDTNFNDYFQHALKD